MSEFEVHTVEARDCMVLEVLKGLGASPTRIRHEIVHAVQTIEQSLANCGISYSALGPALTPRLGSHEIAVMFDIESTGLSGYSYSAYERVLPLLGFKGSHSVLSGDLFGDQRMLAGYLDVHLKANREYTMSAVGTQLFCIYITNCGETFHESAIAKLHDFSGFLGYCDLTYHSHFRTYLSQILSPRFVQHKRTVIQSAEHEEPVCTKGNTLGYPFAGAGYSTYEIGAAYFAMLLSYKIERPILPGFDADQELSLNAVTDSPAEIANCRVILVDEKYEYLISEKSGTLKRLGIEQMPKSVLIKMIREKLRSNYIYRLRFKTGETFSFSGFSMLLELDAVGADQPVRVAAGFEFNEADETVRLVTLF